MAWSTRKLAIAIVAAGMASGLLVTSALADPIKDRRQSMKEQLELLKPLIAMVKGQAPFDAAAVKAAGDGLATHFEHDKTLFPAGSDKGDAETWAKPEVWTDNAAFMELFDKGIAASKQLAMVSKLDDLGPALGNIGKPVCGACHEKFRRPKN